ncbi:unnamed protein product [Mucor hiemalis]
MMLSRLTRNHTLLASSRLLAASRGLHTSGFRPFVKSSTTDNDATTKTEESTATTKQGRANEIIEAVLYGSKKIKEEERQTHSKVLARGKYVHELQIHKVKPDKVDEYVELVSNHLPLIANDPLNDVHLCGSWNVDIGEQDSFVHIWEYKGYPGHKHTMERLAKDPNYKEFMKKLAPLINSRESGMMLEFSFWQTSPPKVTNGIFELRKYTLKPGRLLEWEMNWRKGLECRRQFCEPVGAWFTQLGELNTVYHMWTYPDLQTRKTTREDAWNTEGWPETVYKTVRLVDNMNSFILKPLPFSPLR